MLDIEREYEGLKKRLARYKKKPMAFECGVATGYVTEINLVKDPDSQFCWDKAIEVKGYAGSSEEERVLMLIREDWKKGEDYKYWWEYHVLEYFPKESS